MSAPAYVFWYSLIYPLARLIFPCRFYGRENIPEGGLVICANHSSWIDPVLVALAFQRHRQIFFMSKAEIFKVPVLGAVLRSIGCFPVQRAEIDIKAIRTAFGHLKNGNRVMIFPEGTRVKEKEPVDAKSGALRIALKTRSPILPIYISRKKWAFSLSKLVIGEPYLPVIPENKDYAPLADELMRKIYELESKF